MIKAVSSKLIFGLTILLTLVIAHIVNIFYPNMFNERSARNSPPSITLFQKLLYNNPIEEIEFISNWLFLEESDNEEVTRFERKYFLNAPNRTATVNKEYNYRPTNRSNNSVIYEVYSAPPNFEFRNQEFSWIPIKENVGAHTIILEAYDQESNKTFQIEYILYVNSSFLLFGSNNRGESVFGMIVKGASWTLVPGLIACFFGVILGLFFGAISGYYNNYFSNLIDNLSIVIESIPALIIIFLASVISGFNIYVIMIFVGIVLFPSNYENIKQTVISFKKSQFVESSKEIGFRNTTILWKDIIWSNCKTKIIKQISYCFVFSITIEITLSYLQIGIQPPNISWGMLLYEGRSMLLMGGYWLTVFPSMIIILTLSGFYFVGESLSRSLNPRS